MLAYSKKDLRQLIAQAELAEVLLLLEDHPQIQREASRSHKLAELKSAYREIRKRDSLGIIEFRELTDTRNSICLSLLLLINALP
ncbi:MAG: hypothetical protein AAF696_31860 [Bacteroidota bacterium]